MSFVDKIGLTGLLSILIGVIVFIVLIIVGWWRLFIKAGEKGWKSIIPVYNFYILYKISWKPIWFFISLISALLSGVSGYIVVTQNSVLFSLIYLALLIFIIVISLISNYKIAKAFGHGIGYFFGILFLPNIFLLILAFGKSKYIPEQDRK